MISNIMGYLKLFIIFLPFILFQLLNNRANFHKDMRHKQLVMPLFSLLYFAIMFGFINKFYELVGYVGEMINAFLNNYSTLSFLNGIKGFFLGMGGYIALVLVSTAVLFLYIVLKKAILTFFKKDFDEDSFRGSIAGLFYDYDEQDSRWYLKKSCGQMRNFIKVAYYAVFIMSAVALFWSYELFAKSLLVAPVCPVLTIIVMAELAFFVDGQMKDEYESSLTMTGDNARHITMYALLRKPLKKLFGDKLASEGTTINLEGHSGGAAEDILASIEKDSSNLGKNYAAFIRRKIDSGLSPNVDYLRSGYELACGKSLLFNTPFYYKLVPYAFYAINRCLVSDRKVLIVMGRHGTEDDLIQWCREGLLAVTNVPDMYKISVLSGEVSEDDECDVGIISRSGVHDLDMHKANLDFLKKVGFIVIVEPSRLVTTAQIGLNLLIKCCGEDRDITFCSMDRNCDGLVDSLSHILMTNITEVSATEYPHGMSSFMCWTADDDRLQHRLFPGVSRYLGLGTELSFVALKNQVKETVWYGGDAFPVLDTHWISKQYYYDFLKYANLPTTQESFDQCFKASFNMCNEYVSDNSYITVEDDRNNLFESRRNFATIAEEQGFVNVVSSEYMLRRYMADNTEIFTADAKAIPYITADYARSKRNSVLALCLLLCVGNVSEKELKRRLMLIGIDENNCDSALWKEISVLFSGSVSDEVDKNGNPIISLPEGDDGCVHKFRKDKTLIFKREYSVESGKFENVYAIEDKKFADIILDDLQNAGYIAELEEKEYFIGTELKGHVYQKYLPGQFFTLNGKYYEMISTTADNRIMVRRASEHINGRVSYRQIRKYVFDEIRNSDDMGALKTVNDIGIHYLFADFEVETPGYWKLNAYNDFKNGALVEINGVPVRKYFNKKILKLDFSSLGQEFTESVRKTLTVLLNEVFLTLFAENQPFISAVTVGDSELPSTYSLSINDVETSYENCIFIIEDSQLDIGLLVAVERNIERIMQIISDYLSWNKEKIEASITGENTSESEPKCEAAEEVSAEADEEKKKTGKIREKFGKFLEKLKSLFKKNKKEKVVSEETESEQEQEAVNEANEDAPTESTENVTEEVDEKSIEEAGEEVQVESAEQAQQEECVGKKTESGKSGGRFRSLFKRKKKDNTENEEIEQKQPEVANETETENEAEETEQDELAIEELQYESEEESEVVYSE